MHELAITQGLVDLVAERTAGRRVATVHARVGLLSGVVPGAMSFCFEVATAGTALEGAELVIDEVAGRLACRTCGSEYEVSDQVLLCPCGSADVEIAAGQELMLVSVELRREETSCV